MRQGHVIYVDKDLDNGKMVGIQIYMLRVSSFY